MKEPTIKCKKCDTEFLRKEFSCPSCSHPGITTLYKYVSFNQNSLAILVNQEVWFGKANDLNDPFEFQFSLTSKNASGIPISKSSIEDAMQDSKEIGVFSLSEIPDNILMWSHYSDHHRGFCIEFARHPNNRLGGSECVPVIYDGDTPEYNSTELEKEEAFARIATTKSEYWRYEQEWRMISKNKGNRTFHLPAPITAIIFGERMTDQNKKTILNIMGPEMVYKKAVKVDGRYNLDIVPSTVNCGYSKLKNRKHGKHGVKSLSLT